MAKKKHPGGRPTRYHQTYHPKLVELLARLGFSDQEAADYLGISKATFYNWRKKYKQFLDSIKKGKDSIDDQVENALAKKALGFREKAIKIFHYQGQIITKEYEEYYPPDVGAICFWLKNRRRDRWKDRWDVNVNGDFNVMNYDIPVTDEEKKEAIEQLKLFMRRDDEV